MLTVGLSYLGSDGSDETTADLASSACFCNSASVGRVGREGGDECNSELEKGDKREVISQAIVLSLLGCFEVCSVRIQVGNLKKQRWGSTRG